MQQQRSSEKDFEFLGKLGQGSFGTVYKVKRKKDGQTYVMKQIVISQMDQRQQQEAINEVRILAAMDNIYVVKYYDSFIENKHLNIVMEFCEKGDLSKFFSLQNMRPLQEQKIWKFFIQICLALEYLHKQKVLHRDLKSLNVFLKSEDKIRLGDLGVAKVLSNTAAFAQTMVGTPYYLSPELCEEKPYNEKSDVWALGCILYELCTLKHPFDANNQAALVLKILRGRYNPISSQYNPELRKVIDLCLAKDYKKRPRVEAILNLIKDKVVASGLEIPQTSSLFQEIQEIRNPAPRQGPKVGSIEEDKNQRAVNMRGQQIKQPIQQGNCLEKDQNEKNKQEKLPNDKLNLGPNNFDRNAQVKKVQPQMQFQYQQQPEQKQQYVVNKNWAPPNKEKVVQRPISQENANFGVQGRPIQKQNQKKVIISRGIPVRQDIIQVVPQQPQRPVSKQNQRQIQIKKQEINEVENLPDIPLVVPERNLQKPYLQQQQQQQQQQQLQQQQFQQKQQQQQQQYQQFQQYAKYNPRDEIPIQVKKSQKVFAEPLPQDIFVAEPPQQNIKKQSENSPMKVNIQQEKEQTPQSKISKSDNCIQLEQKIINQNDQNEQREQIQQHSNNSSKIQLGNSQKRQEIQENSKNSKVEENAQKEQAEQSQQLNHSIEQKQKQIYEEIYVPQKEDSLSENERETQNSSDQFQQQQEEEPQEDQ